MRRILLAILLPLSLAACAEPVWAPEEEVRRAAYRHDGPPALTLFTVVSNRDGSGGHTALLVSGSQRVVFDPAGTFKHPALPERNDVVFGMTDKAVQFYKDYHARETFHVVSQEVRVSPEVAEAALRAVQEYGAVPKAFCSNATTEVLRGLPGFETVPRSFSPLATMRWFDALPGVKRSVFRDDSPATNKTIRAPAVL
jgi:hypothetical protein